MKKDRIPGRLTALQTVVLLLLPLICGLICLRIGRMQITFPEIFRSMTGHPLSRMQESVLWVQRMPRILMAALVGAGLAVSGCVFQSMFSNPLATPDTLGVASGASFGAALALLLGFHLIGVQIIAFGFGFLAVVLTGLSGYKKAASRSTVILAGIMIGSLFSSLVSLVKFLADTESELPAITYWLMGSLNAAGYKTLKMGTPVIVFSIGILFLLRWRLNLLPLSEDESRTFGTNIRLLRIVCAVCATAITASCVAMCGQVGWVGLLVPHICRMRFGSNHISLIPASVCVGSAFMILVDTAARSLSAAEIPVSVLTAIIGAPLFIYMLRKSGGWSL